jgi:hypothetical protein
MSTLAQIRKEIDVFLHTNNTKVAEDIELLQRTEAGHHASLQQMEQQTPRG